MIGCVNLCGRLLVIAVLGAALGAAAGTASAGPRVVLDPGHGGSNPGAHGTTGAREKQLTLTLANLVAARLRARGVEVALTRTTDRTLTLRQRVEVANRWPADIFVSIHANASPTRAHRGYETYVLTTKGVDVDARALRTGAITPRPHVDPDIALVLDDVEGGAAQWGSAELAARM
jgi:N-acetylmuramoyl-L-alanine amidase